MSVWKRSKGEHKGREYRIKKAHNQRHANYGLIFINY